MSWGFLHVIDYPVSAIAKALGKRGRVHPSSGISSREARVHPPPRPSEEGVSPPPRP